VYNAMTRNI